MLLSPKGRQINGDNLGRTWRRFGAVLKAHSVRLLKIHSTRHTFATLALEAGRLVTWVSAVLGHADPSFTMRVYAHAIPDDHPDLGFLDDGTKRLGRCN